MWKDLKTFSFRGNVLDRAIAAVLGVAFRSAVAEAQRKQTAGADVAPTPSDALLLEIGGILDRQGR